MTIDAAPGICVATKPGYRGAMHRCPRRAHYGEWCFQHAHSVGGWRLVEPHVKPNQASRIASDERIATVTLIRAAIASAIEDDDCADFVEAKLEAILDKVAAG